jgi:hypothetical protein
MFILKVLSVYCIAVIAIAFVIELQAIRDKKRRRAQKTRSPEETEKMKESLREVYKKGKQKNGQSH